MSLDSIYLNGKFKGFGTFEKNITAAAIHQSRFLQFGSDAEILKLQTANTKIIDLKQKTVIPGLNDSHLHLIRGGLSFNMELRWDGMLSLGDALSMLKEQALVTPPPQWVRVVGGWSEFQFKERRMPTLAEINAVSEETPVFVLHLYDSALLNAAALRAIGYNKTTPDLPGAKIERDREGNPTGMLVADPNAIILYSALAMGPKLSRADQINSTLHFMRELNRLGITSVCDAGGGFQSYPDDYVVIQQLAAEKKLSVRIAYNLFTQHPNDELNDFKRWVKTSAYQQGDAYYHLNGAGEMLVFSAADFEDFLKPRPDLAQNMEGQLEPVVRLLAANNWPFRLHATYDQTIARALTVYEKINQDIPLTKLNWFFDHAETISEKSIERVHKLGGGIAIQNRMAFQGEYFVNQYGEEMASHTPPIKKILEAGILVGLGTDGTRVSSYNPWLCIYWITTGKTIGGLKIYDENNIVSREKALELYTRGSAWFSNEENLKGSFLPNQFADFAVLSKNYFAIPDEEIKELYSILTVLGGEIVHGSEDFLAYNPPHPPASPNWSPLNKFGTYGGCQSRKNLMHNSIHQHHGCLCWAL